MSLLVKFWPGDAFALLAANVLVQIALLVLIAWLLATTLASRRAALCHAIWLSALVGVLLSPATACLADRFGLALIRLPFPAGPSGERAMPSGVGVATPRLSGDELTTESGEDASTTARGTEVVAGPADSADSIGTASGDTAGPLRAAGGLFAAIWLAGAFGLSIRLAHGCYLARQLRRQTRPPDPEQLAAVLADARAILGVQALPPIAICAAGRECCGPSTIGVFRPLVVLPASLLETLDARRLRDVVVHEAAHALRRDPLVGFLQRVVAILYWPYPPVHFLNQRLARSREEVCDNFVLRQSDAEGYAESLLAISETIVSTRLRPAAMGLLQPRWRLEQRVSGLIDRRRNIMTAIGIRTKTALVAAFIAAVVIAAGIRWLRTETATQVQPPPNSTVRLASDASQATNRQQPLQEHYRIQPLDLITIRVLGTIENCPINGPYLVEPGGQVALGPAYGRAIVKDMTLEEAEQSIKRKLLEVLTSPDVQVTAGGKVTRWRHAVLPAAPYKISPGDSLLIWVMGTLINAPITGVFQVEPTGTIPLGPAYGRAQVQGLTLEEAEKAIQKRLKVVLTNPDVSVTIANWKSRWTTELPKHPYRIAAGDLLDIYVAGTLLDQPIHGPYVVEPDGQVTLGPAYGRVKLGGLALEGMFAAADTNLQGRVNLDRLTLSEAEAAVQAQLRNVLTNPDVSIALAGWKADEQLGPPCPQAPPPVKEIRDEDTNRL